MPDAIVIGAGPNGLVAANMLADHGLSVVVLEAEPDPGGAVRSGELTLPGFVHDRFSSFYPLAAASPSIVDLKLEEHGLRWRRPPLPVAHPARDGSVAYIGGTVEETMACLEGFGAGDGEAWRRLMDRWTTIDDALLQALATPFPPALAGLKIARRLGYRGVVNLARFGLLPLRRLADEEFAGAGAARLVGGHALHADFSPEQPGSSMFGWVLCGLAQTVGFPVPEGGSGRLTDALVRRLESRGGTVRCGNRVARIEVRRGRAAGVTLEDGERVSAGRAILADVDAPQLYLELLDEAHVPPPVRRALQRFQFGFSTFKLDFALDGPIPWLAPDTGRAGTVHIAEDVDALTRAMTDIALRQVPAEPFLVAGQYAAADPSRMPPGKEIFWAYTHVPQHVTGDAGGDGLTGDWHGEERERFADRLQAQIEAVAPGFGDRVLARHITAPHELEAADANLKGGALNGGTAQLHQELLFRPIPGLGRSETTVAGLYLASASAWPSGGVHGACGANAARSALREGKLIQRGAAALTRRLSGEDAE
ncbi:NAD(P)/FAD-dependent oxidoreductase [Paraconexibacter antarcticus]|uniref:Pyridine nucleotide-disulfide oxidoreductase domain-containing protein 2 n=1 Tax=Paraconexibacter antarcticus TaxID=2949664 RepID=A0ABY5DNJ8_9ACTN|nr:NAD(P)/FAD-dependent oxidoreductase [Paraconexibacter antarcticus]UTI63025.1 NAD(P)/FAD-dependent oxidoreductase [Paraconexibacter antarcticus]